mmetsp:Transcript_31218/g.47806  ORF Transcript_31218/g.47806 Transcript_31218/m.47806 type:complete len:86 (+) Transcript_31218:1565-1822(+)
MGSKFSVAQRFTEAKLASTIPDLPPLNDVIPEGLTGRQIPRRGHSRQPTQKEREIINIFKERVPSKKKKGVDLLHVKNYNEDEGI